MNEEIVANILRIALKGLFPRKCPNCCKQFATFKEFLLNTANVGEPVFYDASYGNRVRCPPFGIVSMFNCPCGTTITLRIHELSTGIFDDLLAWVNCEANKQGVSTNQIMIQIMTKVDSMVLGAR